MRCELEARGPIINNMTERDEVEALILSLSLSLNALLGLT